MGRPIKLTRGYTAMVDEEDYDRVVAAGPWHARVAKRKKTAIYAGRGLRVADKTTQILMHRFILELTDPTVFVDHIDGNGLNNLRKNMRAVTPAESMLNQGLPSSNTSGFLGVNWDKIKKKWRAYIRVNYKQKFLGYFSDIKDAHQAAKEGRAKYHKEFAADIGRGNL